MSNYKTCPSCDFDEVALDAESCTKCETALESTPAEVVKNWSWWQKGIVIWVVLAGLFAVFSGGSETSNGEAAIPENETRSQFVDRVFDMKEYTVEERVHHLASQCDPWAKNTSLALYRSATELLNSEMRAHVAMRVQRAYTTSAQVERLFDEVKQTLKSDGCR